MKAPNFLQYKVGGNVKKKVQSANHNDIHPHALTGYEKMKYE